MRAKMRFAGRRVVAELVEDLLGGAAAVLGGERLDHGPAGAAGAVAGAGDPVEGVPGPALPGVRGDRARHRHVRPRLAQAVQAERDRRRQRGADRDREEAS